MIVDATVMEKAIAYRTHAKLYEEARERLVKLADAAQMKLPKSYTRRGRVDELRLAPRRSPNIKANRRMSALAKGALRF